jgi:hypothetical protein
MKADTPLEILMWLDRHAQRVEFRTPGARFSRQDPGSCCTSAILRLELLRWLAGAASRLLFAQLANDRNDTIPMQAYSDPSAHRHSYQGKTGHPAFAARLQRAVRGLTSMETMTSWLPSSVLRSSLRALSRISKGSSRQAYVWERRCVCTSS